MEFWNNIIDTALLGTDKKDLVAAELSSALTEVYKQIYTNEVLDKEEKFLQMAAVAFNFRQCGVAPLIKEEVVIKAAVQEEKPYCNPLAVQVLKDILEEQSHSLLKCWLQHCSAKEQTVIPELIPALLQVGVSQQYLRALVIACCGKRGEWLSQFNTDWQFYNPESDEVIWQNGTSEQRKKVLQQLRTTEPLKASAWLQQTWLSENANTKAGLLKQLATNLSAEDVAWLEDVLEEKSQKVKEVALALLKRLSTSAVVINYWNILQKSITLKKEKALLGLRSETTLQIRLSSPDESIFKTGIEKLSNINAFTDEECIIYQLIAAVPPQNWEAHFNSTPKEIIVLFQKEKWTQKFLPAFTKATVQFNNKEWAATFLQHGDELFSSSLISILSEQEQDEYTIKYFEKEPSTLIQLATRRAAEWSIELTKTIFMYTAKNIYQYNRSFYNECIHLISASIVGELEEYTPDVAYYQTVWSGMSEYLIKLITLKQQTIQAFQS